MSNSFFFSIYKYFYNFQIISVTNFPVGAGLASSAAGFAAIAYAFGKLFNFSDKEIAYIARIGKKITWLLN